jgi:2-polyprenyl-3-methyl-5-hydroxy-6-metoxy-1,4-benzoquinol methylase
MPALKELTYAYLLAALDYSLMSPSWISGLPFMAVIWEKLSTSLTKLILDLGQPVRLQQDGTNEYKSYITPAEMRPLVQQTELEELRLFGMHDSLQSVYWERLACAS